jgi:hypothetical protein
LRIRVVIDSFVSPLEIVPPLEKDDFSCPAVTSDVRPMFLFT